MSTYQEYVDARQTWLEAERAYLFARQALNEVQAKRITAWDKLSSMAIELNDADRARLVNEMARLANEMSNEMSKQA